MEVYVEAISCGKSTTSSGGRLQQPTEQLSVFSKLVRAVLSNSRSQALSQTSYFT